jgi:tetratricopeptide (TPR) repeat protein
MGSFLSRPSRPSRLSCLPCLLVLANHPDDAAARLRAAAQATRDHRFADAVSELAAAVEIAPNLASAWYALGQAYTDVSNEAANTFSDGADDVSWRRLLTADSLLANGHMVDAFALYRDALDRLPSMVSIHDSVAQIYERSGRADWAARERAAAVGSVDCAARRALCEFRAGRMRPALDATRDRQDAESRYWRARAAGELARASFKRLDDLPDSIERRSARAARARAEERHLDAIAELDAALALAPGHPALTYELAAACYAARDYERALATVAPIVRGSSNNSEALMLAGYSLLRLRRPEEAIPILQRVLEGDGADPAPRLALGRAYLLTGNYAAAIPLLESQLAGDDDGSLHVQLARAYAAVGERDKAAALSSAAVELQRAADRRASALAQRAITEPR